ncbi:MAG: amidohydrolase family protein [bacterium]|nr:amidohydrolase family protein [bacterium]
MMPLRLPRLSEICLLLMMACGPLSGADEHDADSEKVVALVGAKVYTMVDEQPLSDAVVLIRGSRIEAVGTEIDVPDEATIMDAAGLSITPGFIDAHSRLWLTKASTSSGGTDATLKVLDGADAFSEDWQEVIEQGVTTVCVQPAGTGTTGGFAAVLSVAPTAETGPEVIAEHAALQASIGINAGNNRVRLQHYERIQKLLKSASDYQEKWEKYNAYLDKKKKQESESKADSENAKPNADNPDSKNDDSAARSGKPSSQSRSRGSRGGMGGRGRSPAPTPDEQPNDTESKKTSDSGDPKKESDEKPPEEPKRDPLLEQLVKVVQGRIPMRLEIHSADDFFLAEKLRNEFEKLQLIFEGLARLGSASQQLKQLAAPVVLGPWLELEPNYESKFDSGSHWGQTFREYPGNLVIASRGTTPRSSRFLRAHLAKAIASGLPPENALRAVTANAARLLGQSAELGSIEPGKRADLVAFRGQPTDAATPIAWVMSRGDLVFSDETAASVAADALSEPVSRVGLQNQASGLVEFSELSQLPEKFAVTSERCLLADGSVASKTLVIESGKIVDILEPSTVNKESLSQLLNFDLGSSLVTPGLLSGHTTLGLTQSIDPNSSPDASYVVAGDAIAKGFKGEKELLADGLLRVILAPGDSNPIAGSASLVRIGAERPVAVRQVASKLVLSEDARSAERFPSSLPGQLKLIESSLAGELFDMRLYLPEEIQRRIQQKRSGFFESLLTAGAPVLIVAERDAEIRAALDLVESYQLKALLVGPLQLRPFLPRLKALNVGIVASPIRTEGYAWYVQDLVAASKAGVSVCFAGDSAEQLRLLASQMVSHGMQPESALRTLCMGCNEIAGVHGLAEDAPADFVVWSDSPVSLQSKPLAIIVDGKRVEVD